MNRARMAILAVLSLLMSLGVAFVAYRMIAARANPIVREGRIVVATRKLPLGTRVASSDVTTVAWPASVSIEGGYANLDDVVGRAVITAVVPNEPLLESKLAPRQAGAGLTTAIPEGMRAVAVKVNEVVGVAGFVLPGTHVDVILTGSPHERGGSDTAKVILENVQVLTAGTKTETDSQGSPQHVTVVTLLVRPDEAQKLALAASDGRIQLALRNPLDLERADTRAVSRAALYAAATAEAPVRTASGARPAIPEPEPQPVTVELFQGSQRETVVFSVGEDGSLKQPPAKAGPRPMARPPAMIGGPLTRPPAILPRR